MTVGDLAHECGISKTVAKRIAYHELPFLRSPGIGAAHVLTIREREHLRRLFIEARIPPRAPMLPGPAPEEGTMQSLAIQGTVSIDRRMTVREVAEALNVDRSTVTRWLEKLFPAAVSNGQTTYLDEVMATAIKQAIGTGRNDLCNIAQVREATTELEIAAMTAKVLGYWKAKADELAVQVAEQGQALAIAAPKAESFDRFLDASGTVCISDAAKALGVSPANLFHLLDERSLIFKRAGDWLPFQMYIDRGWFEVKVRTYGEPPNEHFTRQTRVTPKGLDALARIFPREVSA